MRTLKVPGRGRDEIADARLAIWLHGGEQLVRSIAVIDADRTEEAAIADAIGCLVTACTGPFPLPMPVIRDQTVGDDDAGQMPGDRLRATLVPSLPGRVRVNDATLAQSAAAVFDPLGVSVEYVESLPDFDTAYESFASALGVDDEADATPFEWKVDQKLLPPLFESAAKFWRRAPWRYLPDHPPLLVKVGKHGPRTGVTTLYASVLGAAGMVRGVALYYSMEGLRRAMDQGREIQTQDADIDLMIEVLRRSGAPVDDVPRDTLRSMVAGMMAQAGAFAGDNKSAEPDSLAVYFVPLKEVDPSYADWLEQHGLTFRSRQGVPMFVRTGGNEEPRSPNTREVRALTMALDVLSSYFRFNDRSLQDPYMPLLPIEYPVYLQIGERREMFTVTFPPPDWVPDEDDPDWAVEDESSDSFEPELPATEAGARTVYRFLVTLEWDTEVWRRIEVRGDQTLHDLHEAIQDAFDWDDDHLYAFYLSGKAWDSMTEYESPAGDGRSAAAFRLEHLPLHARQRLLYIFDFGDELRHVVRLEAIVRDGAQAGVTYPRIIERHGASVEQYPYADADPDADADA